jgi:ribosomal subunit interface protein
MEREMKLKVRAQDVELTPELRAHLDRQLGSALDGFGDEVDSVIVRFSADGNGEALAKRCQIEVRLRPCVRVHDTNADLFAVVDGASKRAGRAVTRAVERRRESN